MYSLFLGAGCKSEVGVRMIQPQSWHISQYSGICILQFKKYYTIGKPFLKETLS